MQCKSVKSDDFLMPAMLCNYSWVSNKRVSINKQLGKKPHCQNVYKNMWVEIFLN